ncbi:MAG: GNAT family N-acetyltransferase [Candidatus Neomarinimicrobiota bacterium]
MKSRLLQLSFRTTVTTADVHNIRRLLQANKRYFYPHEVKTAVELVTERLAKRRRSGYWFIFAESEGRVVGYTCFGPIPCTAAGFDLYWITVHPDWQGRGIGRELLERTEKAIRRRRGQRIYIETSGRPVYATTRAFYGRCGYDETAILPEFYGPDDDKFIYSKRMSEAAEQQ